MKRYSLIAIVMKYVFFWRRMKVIVSYDNVPSLLIPSQSNKSYKEYLWKVFVKVLFPLADRVILPSNKARLDLVNNFNVPRKITFVNKNWVVQIPKDSKHNKKYDLIYTGRVDPAKNLTYLVDIVKDIKKILPKINVCIVGWGKEIDKIVRLIHQDSLEKNIELVGSQRDVSKFLLSSKVFVLTSHFEGLPISALEAMAHGLPVITTNYPGAEELVVNGRSGHICKNKKQFVRKAVELLKDEKKRRKLGDIAREHVMLNHAEEQLVDFVDLLF
jgi:glycosyltransferase involved in cell wall biosynthesis